jgi:hypothetical protein
MLRIYATFEICNFRPLFMNTRKQADVCRRDLCSVKLLPPLLAQCTPGALVFKVSVNSSCSAFNV